jgi:RNA polymerase sigma-70 factor, ECF subfamily
MAGALVAVAEDRGETPAPRREVDDGTLAACAKGDRAALRLFVVTYQPMVFAYLSRALGHGPHVEDLAQEVFLRAIRALPNFDLHGRARPSTWLLTIAAHAAIDARRRRRELLALSGDENEGPADPNTPETQSFQGEIARAVVSAASKLPCDLRDAFILAEFHDLTMQEVADICGVPINTVKARVARARERMRDLLGDLWEDEP